MTKLAKELTLYGLVMVAIGSCIGSGIFVTPSQIAGLVPSAALIFAVWAIGGVITLTGALPFGGMLVAAIIAVSTLGTIGIYTLSAPRIYYAMAEDGLFFKSIAKVHPVFKTPVNAIIVQSIWAIVLLLFWGTFEDLITYTVSVEWIFFTLAAAGIFIFRKKLKNVERPYKTFGYPVTPLIFICINIWFVLNMMINKPLHMGIGIGFVLLGVPVYFFFKRKNSLS